MVSNFIRRKDGKVFTCTQDFEENPVQVQAIFISGQYVVFRFRPLLSFSKTFHFRSWFDALCMADGWVYFRRYEYGKYQLLMGRFDWCDYSIRSLFPHFSYRDLWRVEYRHFPLSRRDFYRVAGEVFIYE